MGSEVLSSNVSPVGGLNAGVGFWAMAVCAADVATCCAVAVGAGAGEVAGEVTGVAVLSSNVSPAGGVNVSLIIAPIRWAFYSRLASTCFRRFLLLYPRREVAVREPLAGCSAASLSSVRTYSRYSMQRGR